MVIGTPGVGKTTVLNHFLQLCKKRGTKAEVLTIGTLMFEEAVSRGLVKHRDELRKLTMRRQRELREACVPKIIKAKKENDVTILDTHFMVRSRGGYLTALPREFLESVSPELFGVIEASVGEIVRRRSKDAKRMRDTVDPLEVKLEQDLTRGGAFVLASLFSANVIRVVNRRNQAAQAAEKLYVFFVEGE